MVSELLCHPADEAGQLLRAAAGAPVDDRVVARILADTEANPLALIEVGAEFTAEELAGQACLPGPMLLTRRVADRFLRQVAGLEPGTRAFLLLAAAEVGGDRAALWWAAREDGIDAARGQGGRADVGRATVARADLYAGNYDAAVAAGTTVAQHDLAFTAEAILPELIEAACRSDRRSEARSAFRILSERTQAARTAARPALLPRSAHRGGPAPPR